MDYWDPYFGYCEEANDYQEDVNFYRPDGTIEGKSISWCKSNGFIEVGENLWSGKWYYKKFPNERIQICPVAGCRQKFRTADALDRHIRTNGQKAHKKYRTVHGIKAGLTPEDEQQLEDERIEMEAKLKEIAEKRIEREKNELYEILNEDTGCVAMGARRRLQELNERNYNICCPVHRCYRKFETESDLEFHLTETTDDKPHRKACRKYLCAKEKNYRIGCPVKECKRRFQNQSDLYDHLFIAFGHQHLNALKEFSPIFLNSTAYRNRVELKAIADNPSQTRITSFFTSSKKPVSNDTQRKTCS